MISDPALGGRFKDGFTGGLLGAAARHVMGHFDQKPEAGAGVRGKQSGSDSDQATRRAELRSELDSLRKSGTLSRVRAFNTADEAAESVLNVVAPLTDKYGLEIFGNIFKGDAGKYHYTLPQIGGSISAGIDPRWMGYHTHPSGSLVFSNQFFRAGDGNDALWVNTARKTLYVGAVRRDGSVGVAACEYGSCPNYGKDGTLGRVIQ